MERLWTAGENGYYMHTQIRQNNRTTILEGRLSKEECLFVLQSFAQYGIGFIDTAKFSFDF